jgi:hypothetical protein
MEAITQRTIVAVIGKENLSKNQIEVITDDLQASEFIIRDYHFL